MLQRLHACHPIGHSWQPAKLLSPMAPSPAECTPAHYGELRRPPHNRGCLVHLRQRACLHIAIEPYVEVDEHVYAPDDVIAPLLPQDGSKWPRCS